MMNASVRAALVGAVVGLIQFIIVCWRGPGIGFLDLQLLLVLPYTVGLFLSWWGGLPRWWAVAMAGPGVTAAFALFNIPLLRLPENTHLGDWPILLSFMALSATSYLAGGALVMPVHRGLRVLTAGAVAVSYLAVWSAQDVLAETARAQRLAHVGVPLIVPTLPGHRLTHVGDSGPWLELWYEDEHVLRTIDVAVLPEARATPRTACRKSLPWRDSRVAHMWCRQVAPDIWVSTRQNHTVVFATTANALVRIDSETVPAPDLISILRTFHPVTPSELASLQERD
jgi:hypothetical protein